MLDYEIKAPLKKSGYNPQPVTQEQRLAEHSGSMPKNDQGLHALTSWKMHSLAQLMATKKLSSFYVGPNCLTDVQHILLKKWLICLCKIKSSVGFNIVLSLVPERLEHVPFWPHRYILLCKLD